MRRSESPGPGARMTSGCRSYSAGRALARRALCTARRAPTLSPGTASSCPPSVRSPPGSGWRSYRPTQGLGGHGTWPGPSGCNEDGSCEPACALVLPPEQRASHECRSPGAGCLRFVAGGCCRFSTVAAGRSSTFPRLWDDQRRPTLTSCPADADVQRQQSSASCPPVAAPGRLLGGLLTEPYNPERKST